MQRTKHHPQADKAVSDSLIFPHENSAKLTYPQ